MERLVQTPPLAEAVRVSESAFQKRWYDYLEYWLLTDDAYDRPPLATQEISHIDRFVTARKPLEMSLLRERTRQALVSAFLRLSRQGADHPLTDYGRYRHAELFFADKQILEQIADELMVYTERDLEKTRQVIKQDGKDIASAEVQREWFLMLWRDRVKRFLLVRGEERTSQQALDALEQSKPIDGDVMLDAMLMEIFDYTFQQIKKELLQKGLRQVAINDQRLEAECLWRIPEVMPQNAKTNRAALLRALQAMEGGEQDFDYQRMMFQGGKDSAEQIFAAIDQGLLPHQGDHSYILNRFGTHRYYIDRETFDVSYSVSHGRTDAKRAERHGFLLFK
ncbi:MAG: hypothetical protein WCV84_04320 [Patescibacteria group bacterium]